MNKEDILNPILEKKRSGSGELFVNLFEWCNLNCEFCWQDHNDWTGIELIKERAFDILKASEQESDSHIIINLMGGELFTDKIPDEIFEDYFQMVKIIKEKFPENKSFTINWVTNLVYHNTDRVIQLLNRLEGIQVFSKLTTSFDFHGRFKPTTAKLFRKNILALKDYVGTVSVVLTAPNINELLKNNNELFEELYQNDFQFYFDYYSPETNHERMLPTELELQKAFSFLIDHYPNVSPVNAWIKNEKNSMTCQSSAIVGHQGIRGKCRSLVDDQVFSKLKSEDGKESNLGMEERFVSKYNCIQCEYYQRCGLGCFLQHDFQGFEALPECLYKDLYRQIDEKYYHRNSAQ